MMNMIWIWYLHYLRWMSFLPKQLQVYNCESPPSISSAISSYSERNLKLRKGLVWEWKRSFYSIIKSSIVGQFWVWNCEVNISEANELLGAIFFVQLSRDYKTQFRVSLRFKFINSQYFNTKSITNLFISSIKKS